MLNSCRKEKQESIIQKELIVSADTLIFKGNELKNLFISSKTALEIRYKITACPDWIKVNADSGVVGKNFAAVEIVSNLISKP